MLEEQQGLLGHQERKKRSTRSFGLPRLRTSLTFISIAIFSGLIFYLLVFTVILSKPSLRATGRKYIFGDEEAPFWPQPPLQDDYDYGYDEQFSESHSSSSLGLVHSPPSATPTLASEDGLLELSIGELKEMVASTKGYFVRDWSLGLGWNNVSV